MTSIARVSIRKKGQITGGGMTWNNNEKLNNFHARQKTVALKQPERKTMAAKGNGPGEKNSRDFNRNV